MTSPHPLVSIIVPIYGVEKYIRQCVDSILAQSLQDIEIILVNDGSPDACPQIADEYAAKDARVLVIHKPNAGYGHSCNTGLNAAKGDYVAIVEPDDYIEPDMYQELCEIAREHDSDLVKSSFYNFFDLQKYSWEEKASWNTSRLPQNRSFTLAEFPLFLYYHPSIWTCIYKRSFIEQHHIRFIEPPGAGWADNIFQVQTLCLASKINYTDKAYYHYRRVNASEAQELKDVSIPFKRSDEIRQWLNSRQVEDENILTCLSMRELSYIDIALRCVPLRKISSLKPDIDKMLARMDAEMLRRNPYMTRHHLRQLANLRKGNLVRCVYSVKSIRRFLFRTRFRKGDFCLQLFGIQIATAQHWHKPALLRIRLQ